MAQQLNNISSHVLDTATGRPAGGIRVSLFRTYDDVATLDPALSQSPTSNWEAVTDSVTDGDGRAKLFFNVQAGIYKIIFFTHSYFESTGTPSFYPRIEIMVRITDPSLHYHIPLLLSPYGFSTYRGS